MSAVVAQQHTTLFLLLHPKTALSRCCCWCCCEAPKTRRLLLLLLPLSPWSPPIYSLHSVSSLLSSLFLISLTHSHSHRHKHVESFLPKHDPHRRECLLIPNRCHVMTLARPTNYTAYRGQPPPSFLLAPSSFSTHPFFAVVATSQTKSAFTRCHVKSFLLEIS